MPQGLAIDRSQARTFLMIRATNTKRISMAAIQKKKEKTCPPVLVNQVQMFTFGPLIGYEQAESERRTRPAKSVIAIARISAPIPPLDLKNRCSRESLWE